jgi:adenylate cyclase
MKWHQIVSRRWFPFVAGPVISLGVGLLIVGIRWLGGLQALELKAYDVCLAFQPKDREEGLQVILITEDDRDVVSQKAANLTDHRLAQLLSRLKKAGAIAIGLDLVRDVEIPDPDVPGHKGHDELCEVITEDDRIIVGMQSKQGLDQKEAIDIRAPCEMTPDSGQVGSLDLLFDTDQMVRRGLVFTRTGNEPPIMSFAMLLAMLQLRTEGITLDVAGPSLGKSDLRRLTSNEGAYRNLGDEGWQIRLDFKSKKILQPPQFSLTDVNSNRLRDEDIKGKIVMIGRASNVDKDFFNCPLQARVLGVTLHAAMADQLVRMARYGTSAPRAWSKFKESLWIILMGLLGGIIGLLDLRPSRFGLCLITGVVLLAAGAYGMFCNGLWAPLIPAVFSWFTAAAFVTFYVAGRQRKDRNAITQLFIKHVDPAIVKMLREHTREFLDGGRLIPQELYATVIFTDMRGFSSIASKTSAVELMTWLNEYMEVMSNVVVKHGGIINKYMGDSIMAVFGAPVPRTTPEHWSEDATHAIRCALEMRKELPVINARWKADGKPIVGMRIGIYTGRLVGGSIGGIERLEYTVTGDTVNTAARLQALEKEKIADPEVCANDCRILIGKETCDLLKDQFKVRSFGVHPLRGIDHHVEVFGVIS